MRGPLGEKCLESPNYVRTSTAAAMTMGLIPGRFYRNAKLYCINLLLTYNEGCSAKCAYCGLSGIRTYETQDEQSFIRVDWPTVNLDEVLSRFSQMGVSHVERVCVSMITNYRAKKDALEIVKKIKPSAKRISVLITPTIVDKQWIIDLKGAGADMVGIAIDAATPQLFDRLRGSGVRGPHQWKKYWESLREALEVFGHMNASIHLIVGLGETEEEFVETVQRAHKLGARIHLFSFFPEEGSPMESYHQPPLDQYRRMQIARYLIEHDLSDYQKMEFEKGKLIEFGIQETDLQRIIELGIPFMTSGCPGVTMQSACNRPFANETPAQADNGLMRNFPFMPNSSDLERIKRQI